MDLQKLVRSSIYGVLKDGLIRVRIVVKLRDREFRSVDAKPDRDNSDAENLMLLSEVTRDTTENPWRTEVKVGKIKITSKIDTGADVSGVPIKVTQKNKEISNRQK